MKGHQADFGRSSRDTARRLYRAAVQPDPLTNWAGILSEHLGSSANFTLLGPSGRVIDMGESGSHEPERQDYIERYQFINPLNRFWETAPEGQIIHYDQELIDEECRRSEFYSRYSQFLGIQDAVCMLLSVGGSQKVLVNIILPRHARAAQRSKALLAAISEDLKVALEIAGAYLEASGTILSVIDSLDHEGVGVAVMSAEGQVRNANHRMAELLQGDRALHSELRGTDSHPSALRSVADLRKRGDRGSAYQPRYESPDRSRRGRVAVYPVGQGGGEATGGKGKIVLFVTEAPAKRIDLTERLRGEYGLTPTEARVADRLRDGRTSRQIAAEFSVQSNCIRSHLKSIYAKTGTHSQVELLNFLQGEKDLSLIDRAMADRRAGERLYS